MNRPTRSAALAVALFLAGAPLAPPVEAAKATALTGSSSVLIAIGPVQAVAVDRSVSIAGQIVRMDDVAPNYGAYVAIYGRINSDGTLVGTSIKDLGPYVAGASPVFVAGVVAVADAAYGRVRVGGAWIDYTPALSSGATTPALGNVIVAYGLQPAGGGIVLGMDVRSAPASLSAAELSQELKLVSVDGIGSTWGGSTSGIGSTWDLGTLGIGSTWNASTNGIGSTWGASTNGIGSTWNTRTDGIGSTWDASTFGIGSTWSVNTDGIGSTWAISIDGIGSTWRATTNGIGSTWRATTNGIGSTWNTSTDGIGSTWNTSTDGIGSTWSTSTDGIGSTWNASTDGIGSTW